MPVLALPKATLRACLLLPPVIAFGVGARAYDGPGAAWVAGYASGVIYEIFWILLLFAWVPRRGATTTIPAGVLAGTCALEFLQLWHPAWLERIRSTPAGGVWIGTTFSWWDFPHYAAGCLIGRWLIRKLSKTA